MEKNIKLFGTHTVGIIVIVPYFLEGNFFSEENITHIGIISTVIACRNFERFLIKILGIAVCRNSNSAVRNSGYRYIDTAFDIVSPVKSVRQSAYRKVVFILTDIISWNCNNTCCGIIRSTIRNCKCCKTCRISKVCTIISWVLQCERKCIGITLFQRDVIWHIISMICFIIGILRIIYPYILAHAVIMLYDTILIAVAPSVKSWQTGKFIIILILICTRRITL